MHKLIWIVSAYLQVMLCGQQPPQAGEFRERAFGMARHADRSPWAAATVRLIAEPFPGCVERDVVEVTTDERGEFRAEILAGVPYTAWACARVGNGWAVSARVNDVVPRLPVVIDEHHTESAVALRVRGLAAWPDVKELIVWCAGDYTGALALPVRWVDDEVVELPPMGTGARWLFPQAGNGLDLLRSRLPTDAGATFELMLPPPRDVVVTVRGPDGTPIAGAKLEIHGIVATAMPGLTDVDGRTTVSVPEPTEADAGRLPLWALAPGHLTGRLWPRGFDLAGPWQVFLMPGQVTTAVLAWRAGEPIGNAPVWIGGVEQNMEPGRNGTTARPNGSFANDGRRRTDADGRFAMPYATDFPLSLAALLPRRELAALEQRYGASICPLALLHARIPAKAEVRARVDQLRPVRFVFEHEDHRPAPRARVRLGGGDSPGIGLEYIVGQSSAITVMLPVQDDIMLAVWHEQAGDVVRVAVPPASDGDVVATVPVRLPKPIQVTGTVVDDDGRPIAGASVRLGTTLRGRRSEWQILAEEAIGADGPRVNARGYYYPPMAEAMFQRSLHTDADGRFALALPSRGFPLEFRFEHAGREGATEWREAEAAGNGGGDVLLVLR